MLLYTSWRIYGWEYTSIYSVFCWCLNVQTLAITNSSLAIYLQAILAKRTDTASTPTAKLLYAVSWISYCYILSQCAMICLWVLTLISIPRTFSRVSYWCSVLPFCWCSLLYMAAANMKLLYAETIDVTYEVLEDDVLTVSECIARAYGWQLDCQHILDYYAWQQHAAGLY